MNTRFLSGAIASVAAVSTVVIVASAPAYAAGVKSYNASEFRDWNGSSGHAFWFSGLYNKGLASDKHFVFQDDSGMFTTNGDGTATLMGKIVNVKAADEVWDVNIDFVTTGAPTSLKGEGLAPKIAGNTSAENAYAAWDFYDFDSAVLTGEGAYAGSTLELEQKDSNKAVQVGLGANDKNKELGLSSWFNANGTVVYNGETTEVKNSYGDINIGLDPKPVPEPTSLLGIGAVAVGMAGLKRCKQS
ncbi:MAG: PEP-CTERM sorting domain-containing protein [Cyanobacteria bacterium P01_D01_bin.73]